VRVYDGDAGLTQTVGSTIEIVWSAYRSVLSQAGSLAYVSTSITSGKLMQDVLDEMGLSEEELKAHPDFFSMVIQPNLAAGTGLARQIASRNDRPVVAPTIFEGKAQRWSQADYMRMWLRMIEENVTQMFMSPGWEYSNGGCEEYLKAVNMDYGFGPRVDIQPLDHRHNPIPLHVGMERIATALEDVHRRGRKAPVLFSALKGLWGASLVWLMPELRKEVPDKFNAAFTGAEDRHTTKHVVNEIEPLLRQEYGWRGNLSLRSDTGEIRELAALPEGIILKSAEPEENE